MKNPFTQLLEQLAPAPLQVGTVQRSGGGITWVQLPGGGLLRARGEAQAGKKVFVQNGAIQGEAPNLPIVNGEI